MSDLRAETEAAADESRSNFNWKGVVNRLRTGSYAYRQGYLTGATQGPPLLRALEALKFIAKYSVHPGYEFARDEAIEALLEIEAARGGKP